jgi:hypothetical protein
MIFNSNEGKKEEGKIKRDNFILLCDFILLLFFLHIYLLRATF